MFFLVPVVVFVIALIDYVNAIVVSAVAVLYFQVLFTLLLLLIMLLLLLLLHLWLLVALIGSDDWFFSVFCSLLVVGFVFVIVLFVDVATIAVVVCLC